jgi:hypothetical protein
MREEANFWHGHDPVIRLYIPVPTGEHAAALVIASPLSLLRVRPMLRVMWPADQTKSTIVWWRAKPA